MYDEDAKFGVLETAARREPARSGIQHWYDEPPYESDPEDFLMSCSSVKTGVCSPGAAANERYTIVCSLYNDRIEQCLINYKIVAGLARHWMVITRSMCLARAIQRRQETDHEKVMLP